jgi:hypothetical protein
MSVAKKTNQILSAMGNDELLNQIYNLTSSAPSVARKSTPRKGQKVEVETPVIAEATITPVRKGRKPSPRVETVVVNETIEVPVIAEATITPVSVKPYSTYQELINDISIEQNLVEKGFIPIDKILVKDDNNNYSAKYIKVATRNGKLALVELDTEGYVATSDKDLLVIESNNAISVPYSTKNLSLDTLSNELAGVAFVCDDNVCILTRTEEVVPKETFFVSAEKAGKKEGALENSPIPHPVVRYTEILENPECVMKNINTASAELRKRAFELAALQVKESRDSLKELNDEMAKFFRSQEVAAAQLNTSTKQLEELLKGYNSKCIIDANQDKYTALLYNLRKRHMMADELLLTLGTSVYTKDKLNRLTQMIRDKTTYLNTEFKNLNRVLCE